MKRWIFIVLLLVLFLFPNQRILAEDYFCAVYFTYIGCPNCAVTDPIVFTEWSKKYPNLVVIEYGWHGGDWKDPNSQFFGEYAKAYKTQAAVPQLVFSRNNIKLGRIDVPTGEKDIKGKKFNLCPLIDKSLSFEDLDLNQLQAKPKIWANGRVLIKLSENEWLFQWDGENPPRTIGKEIFTQKEIKELLFAKNLFEKLKNKVFDIVEPQKVEFSGIAFPGSDFISFADFKNAIKINIPEKPEILPQEEIKPEKELGPEEEITPEELEEETVELPLIGEIKTGEFSLPVLTFL